LLDLSASSSGEQWHCRMGEREEVLEELLAEQNPEFFFPLLGRRSESSSVNGGIEGGRHRTCGENEISDAFLLSTPNLLWKNWEKSELSSPRPEENFTNRRGDEMRVSYAL